MQCLSFKQKNASWVLLGLLTTMLVIAVSFLDARNSLISTRKLELVAVVQSVHSIAVAYKERADKGLIDREEPLKAGAQAIELSRNGGKHERAEYFYAWSLEGMGIMYPIMPEWSGQNMVGKVGDGAGVDVIQALVNGMKACSNGAAFVSTIFPRPGSTVLQPKLQFIMKVGGWDRIGGAGLYTRRSGCADLAACSARSVERGGCVAVDGRMCVVCRPFRCPGPLNAAVDASCAGEQGHSFVVVASEVRALAGCSAEVARHSKGLISASVEKVERGSVLVDQAGATMNEVVSTIKRATDIMSNISAASNEQSLTVSQVGDTIGSIDQTTQKNAALVEEMAAAASGLKQQAAELVATVSHSAA